MGYLENVRERKEGLPYFFLGTTVIIICFLFFSFLFSIPIIANSITNIGDLDSINLNQMLSGNFNFFFLLVPFAATFFTTLLIYKEINGLEIKALITSRKKIDFNRIFFGFLVASILIIINVLIQFLFSPDTLQWNFNPKLFFTLFLISIFLIPFQASMEEIFFRGYFMQFLGFIIPQRIFPFLISSFLFGIMHFWNPEVEKLGSVIIIAYITMGLFFGAITLLDEGLELAIGFHIGNNLLLALMLTSDWTVFQTYSLFIDKSTPNPYIYAFMPIVILSVIFLIFAKKYKWKNYKQKLLGIVKVSNTS